MKKLYSGLLMLLFAMIWNVGDVCAQTVGIGTDYPIATLDIRTTNPISSMHVQRSLTPSAVGVAAVEINDDSDWGAMDIYYTNTVDPLGVGGYIENSSIGIGVWVTNTNAANTAPAGLFTQSGLGDAVFINMLNGGGDGVFINMADGTNGVQIWTFDDLQNGIFVNNLGYDAWGLYNYMEGGAGVYNLHFAPSPFSFYTDLSLFGALPSTFDNVGYTSNHEDSDGQGFYFTNTNGSTTGGDGFGFMGFANTITPTGNNIVYGAILGAEQYGLGHGILINHEGPSGRNAEFNVTNGNNPDPAIFAIHDGPGSAILAQNHDNTIPGTIAVADIAYTGTDVADHLGVYGHSAPAAGWGYGVVGTGNWFGVYANGDLGASGAKAFMIDHPLDPERKILKHFSIESDKILNVYQGMVTIGRSGKALVELPEYFQAININFTYQLTAVGTPEQPWVAREIQGNSFMIAGQPGSKASWMVIAHRNDAYVRTHPLKAMAELDKKPEELGKYYDPVSHGKPASMGIFYRDYSNVKASQLPKQPERSVSASGRVPADKSSVERARTGAPDYSDRTAKPAPVHPSPEQIRHMGIRQEIKTWDELR